jgi:hypothetical protein
MSLGKQYVTNFVDSPDQQGEPIPLELDLCNDCKLLQLRHTTPPELMYRQYWYKSGISTTMVAALSDITDKAEKLIPLRDGDMVLDTGPNDGTLLRSYRHKNLKLVGFEPAKNLAPLAAVGTTKIVNDYWNYKAFQREFGDAKAKIITSIAMFYDLEDPNGFVRDIAQALDKEGLWIIQMCYLPSMLAVNAFDNICHEHLQYYSLLSLKNLLSRHRMTIFDVELNDVNGGSYCCYIKHDAATGIKPFPGADKRIKDLEAEERKLGLDNSKVYKEFTDRVSMIREQVRGFLQEETAKGKIIYIYGASTKGNVLLQYFDLDTKLIKAATDKNPDKWGKKTVGTMIPIVSIDQYRRDRPDYLLVLPWHFDEEIPLQEIEFLKQGGKMIFPLPQFRIVAYQDVARA